MQSLLLKFLDKPVDSIRNISNSYKSKLAKLDIFFVRDLITHFPFRYTDSSNRNSIIEILNLSEMEIDNSKFLIKVRFKNIRNIYLRGGKSLQVAYAFDETDEIEVNWFNQKYLESNIKKTLETEFYLLFGRIKKRGKKTIFYPEKTEKLTETNYSLHIGRIVSEYRTVAGVSKKWLRTRIFELIEVLETIKKESLEEEVFRNILNVHFPSKLEETESSKTELSIYELVNIQIHSKLNQEKNNSLKRNISSINPSSIKLLQKDFEGLFNFKLTEDQRDAIEAINTKLNANKPLKALLQGDVGSGKTILAMYLCYITAKHSKVSILMAPTTVLAKQHFENFNKIFQSQKINIQLVVSKTKKIDPNCQILIGTSALLFRDKVSQLEVSTLIVDEQHKFGVKQREHIIDLLKETYSISNFLNMTATPIPRTIAQIFFGDLEVITLKNKPSNRLPVKTIIINDSKREDSYKWIASKISDGSKVFWVCPAVEDVLINDESDITSLKSVKSTYTELGKVFQNIKIDLIFGKMKEEQKAFSIKEFTQGNTQILVCSSVIEVGIDISDADLVVIENPERFGLAQLHQIRGRVGRSNKESWCLLMYNKSREVKDDRIEFFAKNNDGQKIAEFDLANRGPGEVYGIKQSGIPSFKIASLKDFVKHKDKIQRIATKLINQNISEIPFFKLTQ